MKGREVNEELTGWFPGDVKPARKGVYERMYHRANHEQHPVFCMWNGSKWLLGSYSPIEATEQRFASDSKSLPWRGLAKEPK